MLKEKKQQSSNSAHTYNKPTQFTLLEHRSQPKPVPNRAGRPCRAHCSMYPGVKS